MRPSLGICEQALIAIGGKATRLRSSVDIPISKSFLRLGSEPFLWWCLTALADAGIRRVLLAYDAESQRLAAGQVLKRIGGRFDDVQFFMDEGAGVHGIAYQARHLLEDEAIFEAGHSLISPKHYRSLIETKQPGNIVFSAFEATDNTSRYVASIRRDGQCVRLRANDCEQLALAFPLLVDKRYADLLPSFSFNISHVTDHLIDHRELVAVRCDDLPEFDTQNEYLACVSQFRGRKGYCT
jgi:hypothetical protein